MQIPLRDVKLTLLMEVVGTNGPGDRLYLAEAGFEIGTQLSLVSVHIALNFKPGRRHHRSTN